MRVSDLRRLLAPLQRRVLLTVGRAIIRLVDDALETQEVQLSLLRGEVRDGVERLQEYGFSSVPLPGARAIALFVGGNRDHGVVVATDDPRYRPSGHEPGETAIYDHGGQIVHLRADGSVLISGTTRVEVEGSTLIRLDAPQVTCSGALFVNGSIQAGVDVQAAGQVADAGGTLGTLRSTYNGHTHAENDNAPAPTQPPGTTA